MIDVPFDENGGHKSNRILLEIHSFISDFAANVQFMVNFIWDQSQVWKWQSNEYKMKCKRTDFSSKMAILSEFCRPWAISPQHLRFAWQNILPTYTESLKSFGSVVFKL